MLAAPDSGGKKVRMRPAPGEVLHFSEDPTITRFVPHVAATAQQPQAYVWAVDAARAPVEPLGPAELVGDLLGLHETAGIQLRVLDNLWCFWDKVTTSTLGHSGIRLHNAKPRP